MNNRVISKYCLILGGMISLSLGSASASTDTIGPNGINAVGLGLTGINIDIGQMEVRRSGDPTFDTMATHYHPAVDPHGVFFYQTSNDSFNAIPNNASEILSGDGSHATRVAGVMIADNPTDPQLQGLAPAAQLFSLGVGNGPVETTDIRGAQHLASLTGHNVRATNLSYGFEIPVGQLYLDGNNQFTLGLDWSSRVHDVLYVVAGNENQFVGFPQDHFNGLTVAASERTSGVYRKVWLENNYTLDDPVLRTTTDILAPGVAVDLPDVGNSLTTRNGTSYAAPHVTGTVALLQDFALKKITMAQPRWTSNSQRHEVMKAILMNSADKLIDDGSVIYNGSAIPRGRLLGMVGNSGI